MRPHWDNVVVRAAILVHLCSINEFRLKVSGLGLGFWASCRVQGFGLGYSASTLAK